MLLLLQVTEFASLAMNASMVLDKDIIDMTRHEWLRDGVAFNAKTFAWRGTVTYEWHTPDSGTFVQPSCSKN